MKLDKSSSDVEVKTTKLEQKILDVEKENTQLQESKQKLEDDINTKDQELKIKLKEIESLKEPDWDELYSNPVMIDLIHKKVTVISCLREIMAPQNWSSGYETISYLAALVIFVSRNIK